MNKHTCFSLFTGERLHDVEVTVSQNNFTYTKSRQVHPDTGHWRFQQGMDNGRWGVYQLINNNLVTLKNIGGPEKFTCCLCIW
jgi:hypothetical protein